MSSFAPALKGFISGWPKRKQVALPIAQDLLDILLNPPKGISAGESALAFVASVHTKFHGDTAQYTEFAKSCIRILPFVKKEFRLLTPRFVDSLLAGSDSVFRQAAKENDKQRRATKDELISTVLSSYSFLRLDKTTIEELADALLKQSDLPGTSEKIFHSVLAKWRSDLIKKDDFQTASKLYQKLRSFCGQSDELNLSFLRSGFHSFGDTFDADPHTGQALLVNLFRLCGNSHERRLEFLEAGFNALTYLVAKAGRDDPSEERFIASETKTMLIDYLTLIQANERDLKASLEGYKSQLIDKSQLEEVVDQKRELENVFIRAAFKIFARTSAENVQVAKNLFSSLEKICAQREIRQKDDLGHKYEFVQNGLDVVVPVLQRNLELGDMLLNRIAYHADVDRSVFCGIAFETEDHYCFVITLPPGPLEPLIFFMPNPVPYSENGRLDHYECRTVGFKGPARDLEKHFSLKYQGEIAYETYAADLVSGASALLAAAFRSKDPLKIVLSSSDLSKLPDHPEAWPDKAKKLIEHSGRVSLG